MADSEYFVPDQASVCHARPATIRRLSSSMYKSVSISVLVAIVAYLTYRTIPTTSHSVDDNMALASVSRHVIKKVLAVETPEVCTHLRDWVRRN